MPRLVRDLFTELGASSAGQELRFCYVQLYNEEFLNLLAPNSGAAAIAAPMRVMTKTQRQNSASIPPRPKSI